MKISTMILQQTVYNSDDYLSYFQPQCQICTVAKTPQETESQGAAAGRALASGHTPGAPHKAV